MPPSVPKSIPNDQAISAALRHLVNFINRQPGHIDRDITSALLVLTFSKAIPSMKPTTTPKHG